MNTNEAIPADGISRSTESPSVDRKERQAELEELLRKHNDELVNYVYVRVGDRAEARDIVQEAYCKIFRLGDSRAISHLRAYLYETAGNLANDWLRKKVVRDRYARDELLRANREGLSPEHIWVAREELQALLKAVGQLPLQCRRAFVLVRYHGLSFEEVGIRLGIKTHSARRQVERAIEYLLTTVSQESVTTRRGKKP
jgi:RNA polymerase sigma factor (sigma-70 family)